MPCPSGLPVCRVLRTTSLWAPSCSAHYKEEGLTDVKQKKLTELAMRGLKICVYTVLETCDRVIDICLLQYFYSAFLSYLIIMSDVSSFSIVICHQFFTLHSLLKEFSMKKVPPF